MSANKLMGLVAGSLVLVGAIGIGAILHYKAGWWKAEGVEKTRQRKIARCGAPIEVPDSHGLEVRDVRYIGSGKDGGEIWVKGSVKNTGYRYHEGVRVGLVHFVTTNGVQQERGSAEVNVGRLDPNASAAFEVRLSGSRLMDFKNASATSAKRLGGAWSFSPPGSRRYASRSSGCAAGLSALLLIGVVVAAWYACGRIGSLCAASRDRKEAGFYLGILLGPLGWIIALLLPAPLPEHRSDSGDRAAEAERGDAADDR